MNFFLSTSEGFKKYSLNRLFFRLVIRTSELHTLRGAVLEDAIPNIKASNNPKTLNTKEVLEYVTPEIQLSCLRLGVQNQTTVDQLLKLDEQGLTNNYKVSICITKKTLVLCKQYFEISLFNITQQQKKIF